MRRTDDPLADFAAYEDERERWLKKLPVCADCDEPIQDDHYFLINDEMICTECLICNYRKETNDYIE